MCYCKNIEMGSYDSQIPMWYDARKKVVGIDVCLALEIKQLWDRGINTVECCCGHNKAPGYIICEDYDMEAMYQLDYEFTINKFGTPIYTPKTVYYNPMDELKTMYKL